MNLLEGIFNRFRVSDHTQEEPSQTNNGTITQEQIPQKPIEVLMIDSIILADLKEEAVAKLREKGFDELTLIRYEPGEEYRIEDTDGSEISRTVPPGYVATRVTAPNYDVLGIYWDTVRSNPNYKSARLNNLSY